MSLATPATVLKQIKSGTTDPLYLLLGEDEIEKSALAMALSEVVEEGLRAFNVDRIHAGDMTTGDKLADGVAEIVAAVHTMPMMVPRRVVMVTQAETLLAPKRESEAALRALERLETLIKETGPQTMLVLVAGSIDKRSRMYKLLTKHATVVECGAITDQADAERWVQNRVAAAGVQIDSAAARRLAERAGPDVKRLRGEVDRLLLYAMGQPRITLDDVREVAGPASLQDDWAMTNAIEAGKPVDALRQLALMLDAGAPPEKILGQLGWMVRSKFPNVAPDSLRTAVDGVFQTDLALKSSGGDPRILLERLVVELCGGKRSGFRRA